jgi:thioredoxin-like negative regulator of GroEL
MSRAFVSENDTDAAADRLPELPRSSHPNYVTARGLRLLEERLAAAQEHQRELAARPDDPAKDLALAHTAREIRYLEARIEPWSTWWTPPARAMNSPSSARTRRMRSMAR